MWRAGARLAVQEDRDVGVAETDFFDEGAQVGDRLARDPRLAGRELLVVDRQDEGRSALCCWANEVRSP
jgi:hypothetical protein